MDNIEVETKKEGQGQRNLNTVLISISCLLLSLALGKMNGMASDISEIKISIGKMEVGIQDNKEGLQKQGVIVDLHTQHDADMANRLTKIETIIDQNISKH